MFKHAQFSVGRFYDVSLLSSEQVDQLLEKIRKEKWIWTYNGLIMPPEEAGDFKLKGGNNPDVVSLHSRVCQGDIPLMG